MKVRGFAFYFAAILFLVCSTRLRAEEPVADPVLSFTVEEDRLPEEKETGGAADFVGTIAKETITDLSPISLAQVLEMAPGVQVNRYGSAAQGAYVSVRGSSPEQVLVLLNGKRLNSAQGGGVDLSSIDPETVERIEVLRGGASARYGENALGGVVNIITRQASKPETGGRAFVHYGSWQTVKAGANIEGGTPGGLADGFLSVSGLYSEGAFGYANSDEADGTTTRENADVKAGDLYGAFNVYPGEYLILNGVLTAHMDEKGVPGLPEFPTAGARMADNQATAGLNAEWERGAARAETGLSASFHTRHYTDPDYALGAEDDTHTNLALQSDTEGRLSFAADSYAAANLTLRFDALRSTALVRADGLEEGEGDIYRYQGSASIRSETPLFYLRGIGLRPILYPSLRFDASLTDDRADELRTWASSFTWQTGISLPWEKMKVKANVGTSYRSPSFDDLFWPSTAFASGNAELKPERAFSWDAGAELTPNKRLRLELAYFDRCVSDLIVWTPGAGGQWRPSNIDNARIRGVEFQGHLSVPITAIRSEIVTEGTASALDPINTTSASVNEGKLLPGKAPLSASASLELRREKRHFIRAELLYTSYRYITAANTKALDPALVLNLGAGVEIGKRWKVIGRLENVLDQAYYDLRDYPVPGREFSVRISYEF